jgi:hypothetical protein
VFLVHSLKAKEKLGTYKAFQYLGDIFLAHNDEHTAMSLFIIALEGFTHMDVHRSRAEWMLRLGDNCREHGDLLKAVELWEIARPLFEQSSQVKQVVCIDQRLADVGEHVLEQYRKKLAHLAELNVPSAAVEEFEDSSDIEALEELKLNDAKKIDPVAV